MKALINFFPVILFFVVYKFCDIYYATAVMIVASLLQALFYLVKNRKLDLPCIITLIVVTLLGSITLIMRNDLFIKWKPTVVFLSFAILLASAQFIWKKNPMAALMGNNISLPENVWNKINLSWILFFILMGTVNLYIIYTYNTDVWVNFKMFGVLGSTLIFTIIQAIYIAKHTDR